MVDTAAAISTAQRLIAADGRTVRLIRYNEVPTETAKPWNGPGDPRKVPRSILDISAVFVSPESASRLGMSTMVDDVLKRTSQVLIVSAGAAVDLLQYDEVYDDEKYWKIQTIETLKPGDEIILTFIGISR